MDHGEQTSTTPGWAPEGPDLWVESLTWSNLADRREEWTELAERGAEPNVFFAPGFALPAAQHLDPLREVLFLAVYARDNQKQRPVMLGFWPLRPVDRLGLVRTWRHPFFATGLPLFDVARGREAMSAALDWLARFHDDYQAVQLPSVSIDGAFAQMSRSLAGSMNLGIGFLDETERAILPSRLEGQNYERRRSASRQWRKLAQLGGVERVSARDPQDVSSAMEAFLALEAGGWKGRTGTALLCEPRAATFARTMSRLMARDGRIRIDCLCVDGSPIAALIVLYAGRRAFLWKIAFDEAFARYSPGLQLLIEYTQSQTEDGAVDLTDSCADQDNELINRLWSDRQTTADLFIGLRPGKPDAFEAILASERMRRTMRARVKKIVHRASGLISR